MLSQKQTAHLSSETADETQTNYNTICTICVHHL